MVALRELVSHLDNYLQCAQFNDYCPNGLQVEGRHEVGRIVTGVTASAALIDEAVARNADAILVHHGLFWKGDDPCVIGLRKRRLAALLRHDISLLAYHLPLDVHADCGNNVLLGRQLGLQHAAPVATVPSSLLWRGHWANAYSVAELIAMLESRLATRVVYAGPERGEIQTVAWCTGAAQKSIEQAASLGVDAYITGEISESTTHIARESGLHFFAAGHHATERYGARALGEYLARQFSLQHENVDIHNPA